MSTLWRDRAAIWPSNIFGDLLLEKPQYLQIINYLGSHESVTNSIVVSLLGVKSTRAKVILREMVENMKVAKELMKRVGL